MNIEWLIVIPPGQELQTRLLFACTVVAFFLAEIQSPFGVATFYMNRLDLQNAISVLQQSARVAVIVGLFYWLQPQVWQVGLAALLSMCIGWGWTIRLWRRLTPTLRISLAHFKLAALRSLVSMGGWMSVNYVGAILFLAIDLLVVNRLFGSEPTGRYAAALQWSGLLRTIASVISGAFAPTIFYLYARNEMENMVAYTRRAVKFVGLMIALPIGLICGLSRPLLETWLGAGFADLAPLMSLLTIHLSVNLAVNPLFNVQAATNHVRTPAIMRHRDGRGQPGLGALPGRTDGMGTLRRGGGRRDCLVGQEPVLHPALHRLCPSSSPRCLLLGNAADHGDSRWEPRRPPGWWLLPGTSPAGRG